MELVVILLLAGSMGVGWRVLRRPENGPAVYWVAGWLSAGAGAILLVVRHEYPLAHYLSYPLGTLFPALLLAGACAFASRPVPRWLLPAALGYGLARSALVAAQAPIAAWAAALVLEPIAVLAAARLVARATPRTGASRSQRLLAPSLCLLAATGVAHALWLMHESRVPPGLLVMWVVSVPALFGVQLHAEWERVRGALQRARDELEQRVGERTALLRESEERYRVASELGSDLSFGLRVDRTGRLYDAWFSDAFPRVTGYSLEEMKGGAWFSSVHPEDLESDRRQFAEVVAGRSREMETRLVTKDGRQITVHARIRATEEPGGVFHILGAARDLTEVRRSEADRRRLERHMFEAQRLESLAVLTGGVAHDFNNLLAVILGNSRMAQSETPPEAPLHARLTRIRAAAEHGARLTEQMLAYSGGSSVALKPIDLSQLVQQMADLLHASVAEGCRLELDLAPHAPVEGDSTQLQQVVVNLVTNASEALAGRDGCVRVRTGCAEQSAEDLAGDDGVESPTPGSYAFVEVVDDGPGMDAATRARIFEPFFTTKFSGRGLGLAAVLGIVRAHHGVARVQSEPGRGTTLRVLLPSASATAVRSARAAATQEARGRRGTVLVIDDQDSVVEVAQILLEKAGHRVFTSVGGRAGIELFRSRGHEIDAVLLDLAMPDADGEEVLRELQRLRRDVRVIIATGYGAGYTAERIRSRVSGFVRKPYEPEEMLEQIDRALAAS